MPVEDGRSSKRVGWTRQLREDSRAQASSQRSQPGDPRHEPPTPPWSSAFLIGALASALGCPGSGKDDTSTADGLGSEPTNDDGGHANGNIDDEDVVAAAAFAADVITGEAGTVHEVLCAQEPVVAGTNYRLGLAIGGATWLAVVYEDLDGSYELSSSEEIE